RPDPGPPGRGSVRPREVERLGEVVHAAEVVERVLVRLAEQSRLDEREDDPPEVLGRVDAPPTEHESRQPAELVDRELTQTEAQLPPGDVPRLLGEQALVRGALSVNHGDGVLESFLDEDE